VEDAGNGILWRDDSQVVSIRVIKRYGELEGVELYVRDADIEDLFSMPPRIAGNDVLSKNTV
jgi:hypothetical protein